MQLVFLLMCTSSSSNYSFLYVCKNLVVYVTTHPFRSLQQQPKILLGCLGGRCLNHGALIKDLVRRWFEARWASINNSIIILLISDNIGYGTDTFTCYYCHCSNVCFSTGSEALSQCM